MSSSFFLERKKIVEEKLKSRLGFILISAGCAIGIGMYGNSLIWQVKVVEDFCITLFIIFGNAWNSYHVNGVCCGTCKPEKSGSGIQSS